MRRKLRRIFGWAMFYLINGCFAAMDFPIRIKHPDAPPTTVDVPVHSAVIRGIARLISD